MLRHSIQQNLRTWTDLFSILGYQYNASPHFSNGLTPFQVEIAKIPNSPDLQKLGLNQGPAESVLKHQENLSTYNQIAKDSLLYAKARMTFYENLKTPTVEYAVGDLVLLKMDDMKSNISLALPSKWRPKHLGPLKVKKN